MNIQKIVFLFFISISPNFMQGMQSTIEEQLFDGKVSPRQYLSKIAQGLYGHNIALQMRQIRAINYQNASQSHPSVKNLYEMLRGIVTFAMSGKSVQTPENIKKLIVSQIEAKHRMLMDYVNKGLVEIPSTSGSGD